MNAVSSTNKAPIVYLTLSTKSAQVQSDNNLPSCGRGTVYFERTNHHTGDTEHKSIPMSCGRKTCPRCLKRKRMRLLRRVRHIAWRNSVVLWTITTDPNTIDPLEALKTLNDRWHHVHRELLRFTHSLRYFRVVELTKSGLPHLHIITDTFIDWHKFQLALTRWQFGRVLHFERADQHRASLYCTKYVLKEAYNLDRPEGWPVKVYSSSIFLIPKICYIDPDGNWRVVYVDFGYFDTGSIRAATRVGALDLPPPQ